MKLSKSPEKFLSKFYYVGKSYIKFGTFKEKHEFHALSISQTFD